MSLRVGFFCENRPFSSRNGSGFRRVSCTSADTPAVFGVSSAMELKAKPPNIKSTPWLFCDFLCVRSRPSSLSDVSAINTANWLQFNHVRRRQKNCIFKHISRCFSCTVVRDKKDSGKWNATRDKRLATKYSNGSDLWLDDKNSKIYKLGLDSLLVSIVNHVSWSGTMKYQFENTDVSNKKWLLT